VPQPDPVVLPDPRAGGTDGADAYVTRRVGSPSGPGNPDIYRRPEWQKRLEWATKHPTMSGEAVVRQDDIADALRELERLTYDAQTDTPGAHDE
jgi:hypothetical protein